MSLWLSNYRQNLLTHLSRQKEARRAGEKKRGKSLITLACSTVRSLIKPSYLPVTPSRRASLGHICALSSIKYLGIFFSLKIIQDFCLGWILRRGNTTYQPCQRYSWLNGKVLSKCVCLGLYVSMRMSTRTCVFQLDKCTRITLALAS